MIKLVHISDLHLDSPFAHLLMSERAIRRNEQREALLSVCNICKNENVNLLLISGDLFDREFVSEDTPAFLASAFSQIPETRVFISPGNHDCLSSRSPYNSVAFPDNVHLFTQESMSYVDIPELNCTVYGFAFCGSTLSTNPLDSFHVRDESRINILCAHGELDVQGSEYYCIDSDDLAGSKLDYAALGHIHKFSNFSRFGFTCCAYSGCPIGRGFDECGQKGMIIGSLGKGINTLAFRVLENLRRYERYDITLSGNFSESDLVSKLRNDYGVLSEKCSLRVLLHGSVQEKLSIDSEKIKEKASLSCAFEIQDETYVVPDMSKLVLENSLRGEFCRKISTLLESDDEEKRKIASLALQYGLMAFREL